MAGFTYAEIAVVLGDSLQTVATADSDRRVNGYHNINLNIVDRGSTGTLSNRALCGITQSWKAPNLMHDDIHFHVYLKTNNATRTLAAFRLQNVPEVGWMNGNIYRDIKVSGVIDRSAQTLSGSTWADYSVNGIQDGETGPYPNSPVFDGVDFSELRIINGAVTGNLSQLLIPNATGIVNLRGARQGISLSVNAPNARVILTNASMAVVSGVGSTSIIYPAFVDGPNGYRVNDDGTIQQWMLVNYTATSGATQTFNFPKPFTKNARIASVDPVGLSNVTVSIDTAPTTTGVTVRCSATGVSLYISTFGS